MITYSKKQHKNTSKNYRYHNLTIIKNVEILYNKYDTQHLTQYINNKGQLQVEK